MTSKTDIELIDPEETASNGVQSEQPDCKRFSGTSNASNRSSLTSEKAKKNNVTFREGEAQKIISCKLIILLNVYLQCLSQ